MSIYRYYVYAYIRSKDSSTAKAGTPYYIGKGTGRRAWMKHKNVSTPSDSSKIIILESNLSEIGSLALERRMISWWGRKDLQTGILLNKVDGGEGAIGVSPETRKKISEFRTGLKFSETTKKRMSESALGKEKSPETRKKMSMVNTGKKLSIETKKKLSDICANRSPEEKEKISKKLSDAYNKKTLEEKQEYANKQRNITLNKTPEEKFLIAEKKRKTREMNKLKSQVQ